MAILVMPLLIFYKKEESLLYINSHNGPFLDLTMYHITRLPEITYIIFVIFLGVFTQRRYFFAIVAALLLCIVFIAVSKFIVFADSPRPSFWLDNDKIPYHKVNGITLHRHGSFPSGHTMAAFCALSLVGFISSSGLIQFFLFLLAVLTGYSRIYVAQHYLVDVYTGALAGYILAYVIFMVAESKFSTPYWHKPLFKL